MSKGAGSFYAVVTGGAFPDLSAPYDGGMGKMHPDSGTPRSWPKYVGLAVLAVAAAVVVYLALTRSAL